MKKKQAVNRYQLEISQASEDDLNVIQELAQEIWPVCYRDILTPEQISNMLLRIYNLGNLQQEQQQGHRFWLAYANKTPVGYASAYVKDGDIFLRKIYVHPNQQDAGIGTRLLRSIAKNLQPAENITLMVNNRNVLAHSYYELRGFKKTGETPVQMGDYHFTDYIYSCPAKTLL